MPLSISSVCAKEAASEADRMDKLPFAVQGRPKKTARHFAGAEGAARVLFDAGRPFGQSAFGAKTDLHKGIQSHANKKEKLESRIQELKHLKQRLEEEKVQASFHRDVATRDAAEAESELFTKKYTLHQTQQQLAAAKVFVKELEATVDGLLGGLENTRQQHKQELEKYVHSSIQLQGKHRQLRNKCPSSFMQWAEACGDEIDTDHWGGNPIPAHPLDSST